MNLLNLLIILALVLVLAILAVRAIGGHITLIEDWRKAWRFYSTWGLAAIGLLPDIYNGLATSGYLSGDDVPQTLTWAIRIGAALTFVLRMVKQIKPNLPDDTDRAGA